MRYSKTNIKENRISLPYTPPDQDEKTGWGSNRCIPHGKGYLCYGTHPKEPNWSGNARGRSLHVSKDETLTLCNLLIEEFCAGGALTGHSLEEAVEEERMRLMRGKLCKTCF